MTEHYIDIPPNETRIFKSGILPNKLKYVVIEDSSDDISHVSMAVKVGSLDEPIEYMGLAHFLEHMLFMGSEKYRKESYFEEILKINGGSCNAYTGTHETVYFFNVLNKNATTPTHNLEEVLQIFSRFFIDPLFDKSSVEREINAINSEHLKNQNDDFWFTRQVIYNLSKKNSGINRFSTGTLETLGSHDLTKLRDEMIQFYNSYYCSDNMCLTIQSNIDVKIIESIIIKIFSLLPIRKSKESVDIDVGKFDMKNTEYQMIPSNDINEVIYFWDIPTFYTYLNNCAINVIDNIFEYNGVNNLKYILRRSGLASNVVGIYLEEGIYILKIIMCKYSSIVTSIKQINNIIRYYLDVFIQDSKLISWDIIYKYMIGKYNLNYLYDTKINNSELVNRISVNQHYYNSRDVYKGSSVIIKPDIKILNDLVKMLQFSNVNIIYFTKTVIDELGYSNLVKDKYYLKKYGKLTKTFITQTIGKKYNFTIDLDKKYLSIKPVIIKDLDKYSIPSLIDTRIWYGASSKFNEPFVYGLLYLSHTHLVNSIENYILTTLSCSILNQYIAEIYSQQFELGYNITFNVSSVDGIVSISIVGLNSNYTIFFNKVMETIKDIRIEDVIIKLTIDKLKENLININNKSPWEYINYIIGISKYKYQYKSDDMISTIEKLLTHNYITLIGKRIKRITHMIGLSITSIIYGNINKEIPKIKSGETPSVVPLPLPLHDMTIKHPNKDEKNKLVMFSLPCGLFTPNNAAQYIILSLLLEQPTYQFLRTKNQLGYLVKSSLSYDNLNYSISIKVQSTLDIKFIETKMHEFIKWFSEYLDTLDSTIFDKIKESAVGLLLSKPTNMSELMNKYIGEIRNRTYIFNRNDLIAKQINAVDIDIIKKLYNIIKIKLVIIKIIVH